MLALLQISVKSAVMQVFLTPSDILINKNASPPTIYPEMRRILYGMNLALWVRISWPPKKSELLTKRRKDG